MSERPNLNDYRNRFERELEELIDKAKARGVTINAKVDRLGDARPWLLAAGSFAAGFIAASLFWMVA